MTKEEEGGVRRYRSDNLQNYGVGNINGLTKEENCKICVSRGLSFDDSINKIMANISDGVILISPAKIQGKRSGGREIIAMGNAQIKSNLKMDGFGIHLQEFKTDSNQIILMNIRLKEIIQRYAYLDKN